MVVALTAAAAVVFGMAAAAATVVAGPVSPAVAGMAAAVATGAIPQPQSAISASPPQSPGTPRLLELKPFFWN